ncbi:hypothetical protein [Microcoleus sp. N9_A1]|uniref:hypothetical protein n=1 Tax=Microcoleus sp. N9_A1 TaxID=3055380 RepID=UPI002FD0855C
MVQVQDRVRDEVADEIFSSIDPEQVRKLNELFWKADHSKLAQSVAVSGAAVVVGGVVLTGGGAFAATGGAGATAADAAAGSIAAGVTNAIDMIQAIDGIGLAAFGVALAPMGFMVTLRVLNMVLSRV